MERRVGMGHNADFERMGMLLLLHQLGFEQPFLSSLICVGFYGWLFV
jgi:hypothetical protein